jgi:hypothetical protein
MGKKLSETCATINERINARFVVHVKCGTVKIIRQPKGG